MPHALETIQRFSWSAVSITCLALAPSLAVPSATPAQAEEATDPGPAYSISRGGKLYDNWMVVLKAAKPSETHPAWPASNTKRSGDVTWRCKSCHGWDLMGRDGAYAKGSYETGIKGLKALDGGKPAAVIAVMKHASHGFDGLWSEADFVGLANFVTRGQIGFSTVINYADKSVTGGKAHGKDLYQTLCVACHGLDGREPKEMDLLRDCQPLARFRTGDIIVVEETAPCICGRTGFRFRVVGRSDDMVVVRGLNLFPSMIGAVLGRFAELSGEYRIRLAAPPPYDRLPVEAELAAGRAAEPGLAGAVAAAIKADLGATAEVRLLPHGALPRTEGKTRRVVRGYE